jgi:predicted metal-dependent HD superfamily phosphohydrolase
MTDDQDLQAALLTRFGRLLPGHEDVAEDLLARYGEPHRHYHDRRHLGFVLDRIDDFATAKHDAFSVGLAAWFHDAVYAVPVGQISNEEASARLAIRTLGRCGLEQEEIGEIARLVRLTQTHRPTGSDPDGELLCDADLAILAVDPERYRRYVADVRQEYARLDDEQFDRGRLAVLMQFGGRTIFRTTAGRRSEAAAQQNLATEALALVERLGNADELDPEAWPLTAR